LHELHKKFKNFKSENFTSFIIKRALLKVIIWKLENVVEKMGVHFVLERGYKPSINSFVI